MFSSSLNEREQIVNGRKIPVSSSLRGHATKQIVLNSEIPKEMAALRNKSNTASNSLMGRELCNVGIVEIDMTLSWMKFSRNYRQQGRFTRAICTDDRKNFAFTQAKRKFLQSLKMTVMRRHAVEFQ
jgi:hypothetical protein